MQQHSLHCINRKKLKNNKFAQLELRLRNGKANIYMYMYI